MDRFKLEEQIMAAWGTKEDIETVTRRLYNSDDWSVDEIANMLIGITALHDARCNEMFDTFSKLIKSGNIK